MKIAIISDVHNNTVNLEKVLNYCKDNRINTIICCGDLASLETLDFLNDNFPGVIHYTFGNMDNEQLIDFEPKEKYKNTFLYRNFGEINVEGKKIAFVHFPNVAEELAGSGRYDFVFYGHTHKPWEQMFGQTKMLNPGNVAGEIYSPTFAEWETGNDNFKLIRVHEIR